MHGFTLHFSLQPLQKLENYSTCTFILCLCAHWMCICVGLCVLVGEYVKYIWPKMIRYKSLINKNYLVGVKQGAPKKENVNKEP